jgi:hypothetical protein
MTQCFNCGKTDPPIEVLYYYNEITEHSVWLCKECYERYKIKHYLKSNEVLGLKLPQFVKDSLEKQLPKKPITSNYWGHSCPMCGNGDINYHDHHCPCGQRLDWSEFE